MTLHACIGSCTGGFVVPIAILSWEATEIAGLIHVLSEWSVSGVHYFFADFVGHPHCPDIGGVSRLLEHLFRNRCEGMQAVTTVYSADADLLESLASSGHLTFVMKNEMLDTFASWEMIALLEHAGWKLRVAPSKKEKCLKISFDVLFG